jgi:hypothetical protein
LCHFHILRQYGRQPAELRYDQQNTTQIPPVLFFFNRILLSAAFQSAVFSSGPSEATFATDGPRTAAGLRAVVPLCVRVCYHNSPWCPNLSCKVVSLRRQSAGDSGSRLLRHRMKFRGNQVSEWLRAARSRGESSSPGRGKISLLSTSSRPVLGPTQPPT